MPEEKGREMTRGKKEPADVVGIDYIIPILVGTIGGFLFLIIPFVLFHGVIQVSGVSDIKVHNVDLEALLSACIVTVGSVFSGFVSACILGNRVRKPADVLKAGCISGAALATEISVIYLALGMRTTWVLSVLFPADILIIVIQIIGATGGYLWFRNLPEFITPSQPVHWERAILKPMIVTIIVIILIFIIPFAYSHVIPEKLKIDYDSCYGYYDVAEVEQLSEDTIRITQLDEVSRQNCPFLFTTKNKIFLDDHEVSNQSIIRMNGLSDTIDPSEGLAYGKGSEVILKGPEVSNSSHNPRIGVWKCGVSANGSLIAYQSMFLTTLR